MKQKLINAYMKTAQTFAECSTARRLHVGAIVVKDDRIISIGYNGMPAGWDNNCEDKVWDKTGDYELKTKPEVLHAEMNSLMKLARSNESGLGASMFVTHSPCLECAKGIYQAGIKKVYFGQAYRDSSGVEFLNKCKVIVEQIDV
jgi:dCMP deaminase